MRLKTLPLILFFFTAFHSFATEPPITVVDMRYLLNADMDSEPDIIRVWDELHAITTLQGIVNREQSRLYIKYVENGGRCIDEYWWNKYRRDGEWLSGRDTLELSLANALSYYRNDINGLVVYDSEVPSTSNVASAIAGIDHLIAVRYDNRVGSLYSQLTSAPLSLPVRVWLVKENGASLFTGEGIIPGTTLPSTGSIKDDPYYWFMEKYMRSGRCDTRYAGYYLDQAWRKNPKADVKNHHCLTNHDFFVSKGGFFFDLSPWGDEPATDDPGQPVGSDLQTLKDLLQLACEQNGEASMCHIGGFPAWAYKYTQHVGGRHEDTATEWEYDKIISAYNAWMDADAISLGAMANASFWQHFPLQEQYPQPWISREALRQKGYLDDADRICLDNKHYYIFYVGDYDASAWITQQMPAIWEDDNRGSVPLMWCISPALAVRAPMAMHAYRTTATPNDYFAAADNGAGYISPGMLQSPRAISGLTSGLGLWERHCRQYYDQWGLTITGFIIDGYGPALNQEGLSCYRAFSPNGIVPQKSPDMTLHQGMPVFRAGIDVQYDQPSEAAENICAYIRSHRQPFYWFRNILKSPSWYKSVVEQVKARDPQAELLDAPTFFELYRIYLEQHSVHCQPPIRSQLIDSCDDLQGWGGSGSLNIDTQSGIEGSGCLQADVPSHCSSFFEKTFSVPFDTQVSRANGYFSLALYISDIDKMHLDDGDTQIEIGSGGQCDHNELHWEALRSSRRLHNGWNALRLKLSDAIPTGGDCDLSRINYIRIYHVGAEALTLKIDDLRFYEATSFDSCDDTGTWRSEGSMRIDTDNAIEGQGCISTDLPARCNVLFEKRLSVPFNTGVTKEQGVFSLAFYISDIERLHLNEGDTEIEISSSGTYDQNELCWQVLRTESQLKNGWNRLTLRLSDAQENFGNCDLSNINYLRIYHTETEALTVKIDDLVFYQDDTQPTDIAKPSAPTRPFRSHAYSLQGIRMDSQQPVRGIYITDGKKTIVR